MDWSVVEGLLRCELSHPVQAIFAVVGAAAGLVTITVGVYRLWRWWVGPSSRHKRAARALRNQGHYHARLKHRQQAMELYDLSIQLNPRAAHVYYLRGCLRADMGEHSRAVADWKRCLWRLSRHVDARRKLEEVGDTENITEPAPRRWAYVLGAGVTAVIVVALVGFLGR